jgi:hypothetical protein
MTALHAMGNFELVKAVMAMVAETPSGTLHLDFKGVKTSDNLSN